MTEPRATPTGRPRLCSNVSRNCLATVAFAHSETRDRSVWKLDGPTGDLRDMYMQQVMAPMAAKMHFC